MSVIVDYTPRMAAIERITFGANAYAFEPPVPIPDRASLEVGDGFVLIDGERTDGRLELEVD